MSVFKRMWICTVNDAVVAFLEFQMTRTNQEVSVQAGVVISLGPDQAWPLRKDDTH